MNFIDSIRNIKEIYKIFNENYCLTEVLASTLLTRQSIVKKKSKFHANQKLDFLNSMAFHSLNDIKY